jgi:2-octaprenyl-6-methoxyphenol hydroxylase
MKDHYDIVIVGGGMVGASLAVALAPLPLSVAVIEASPLESEVQPSYDDRSTAVAEGSRRIFEAMGCWREIEPGATRICHIHVSDRGHFGFTRMDCRDYGVAALGHVVENRSLGAVLWASMKKCATIDLVVPASVVAVRTEGDVAVVEVEGEWESSREVTASLVIAADGVRSRVRGFVGLETTTWDYGQTAVIANVSTTNPHDNAAYERFTASGPLALLPMSGGRCSLVWTLAPDDASDVMSLEDSEFLDALQHAFGYRLGRIGQTGRRVAYPLSLTRALDQSAGRVLLIGNASHGIHPVGGQGFNLGLRDVATLAELIADSCRNGLAPGGKSLIDNYIEWRKPDHNNVMAFTDSLIRVFSNPLAPVKVVRALGLIGLDLVPAAKNNLARRTMGLHGRLPRLARGLPLS